MISLNHIAVWHAKDVSTFFIVFLFFFIYLGTKPTKVEDFSCQAFDYTYMICSFTIPKNTVPTTYNLKYVAENAVRFKYNFMQQIIDFNMCTYIILFV